MISNYYRINVALRGSHFFATAQESIRYEQHAMDVARVFAAKFPASEGYIITVMYVECSGKMIAINAKGELKP